MNNFVSLRSLLTTIPKAIFNETDESDILFWFREGLRLLPSITATETKVEIFEIVDGAVQLPKYIKVINSVDYMYKEPTEDCLKSYSECLYTEDEPEDLIPQVCKPQIYYKMFVDSPYYKNNYTLLKYVGSDKSLLCQNCPNLYCDNTNNFVLTREKMLYTNFNCGFICVNYDTEVCDSSGNLMIPDFQEVHNFLQSYAIKRHLEERMFGKEEGISSMYQMYSQKSDIEYNKARGVIMLKQLNPQTIEGINNGWFRRFIKLPSVVVYER